MLICDMPFLNSVMKSFVYFKIVLVEKGWYFETVVENSHKLKSQGISSSIRV